MLLPLYNLLPLSSSSALCITKLRLDAHFLIIEREALSSKTHDHRPSILIDPSIVASDLMNAILELQDKEKGSPTINIQDSVPLTLFVGAELNLCIF